MLLACCVAPTGDGDPPDDSAAAYMALKKSWPEDRLLGVKFSVLGLGDSNYTRFMHVPRVIKNRCVFLSCTNLQTAALGLPCHLMLL